MAAEEGLLTALVPDGFVASGLPRFLARLEVRPSKKPKRPALPAVKRLKACYGKPVPELEKLDKVLSSASFLDTAGLYEWTPEVWGPVIEPAKGKNLAEELITWAQEKWPPLLEELFGGGIPLGWTKSGDLWLYGLYDASSGPERHAVHLWSHGSARIKATVAADLDSFALAQVLGELVADGAITAKAAARVAEQLAGRVCLSWPFDRVLEKLLQGKPKPFPGGHHTAVFTDRAAWIKVALLGEPESAINVEFEPELNPALDDKDFKKKLGNAAAIPPTAFYLLFRSFFFGQQERLAEVVAACEKSPAPLVRDAGKLMDQLRRGRKDLGQILDVQQLRDSIVAMGLDPEAAPPPAKAKAKGKKPKAKRRA